MKTVFSFKGIVVLTMEHETGEKLSRHVSTDFNLEASKNIDASMYLENGLPTKEGCRVLSKTLAMGIVGNIHLAHSKGWMKDHEHLKMVIDELQRGFVENPTIDESNFSM